jgi:hypothetical protein
MSMVLDCIVRIHAESWGEEFSSFYV